MVPLQFGPLDGLLATFGPFVIPVALFAAGFVGYLVLVALGRVRRRRGASGDGPTGRDD